MQKMVSTMDTMEKAVMTNLDQLRHCSGALRRILFAAQCAERKGPGLSVTIPNRSIRSGSPDSRIKWRHSRTPKRSERSRSHSRSRSTSRSRSRSRSKSRSKRSDRSVDRNKRRHTKAQPKEKSKYRSKKPGTKPNPEIKCPKLKMDSISSSSDESDLLEIEVENTLSLE